MNGKYLACGDESGKVVVWNCEDENAQALVQCFSGEVGQSVSSLYIDADGLFLVVGTQSGQIWTLTDWNAQGLQAVEGLRHLPGLSGPISYIFYAPYWKETSYEQAVYVLYSCGYVVVLNPFTREIRAYSGLIKPEDTTEEGDEQDKIIFGFVVSTKFEQITKVTEEMQQSILNFTPPSDSSQQPVESKSFMKKLKRGSGEVITLPPMKIPPNGPRYLLFVKGKYLIRCDLSKFARPISSSISSSSSSSSSLTTFSSTSNVLIQVSQISTSNIITCQLLSYIEDATRFWSKPILSISFLDEMSDMYFLTPKSCFQLNRHDSLPNVLTDPYNITNAIILSNGCTYICSNKNIIYSVNPYNPEYLLSDIPPSRSEMSSIPPDVSQQLLQKEVIDSTIKTKSKRRSSFLTLPSSGIDLDKLFIKTFDMKQKEEIFNRRSIKLSSSGVGGGESKEEYTIKSDNVKDNTTSALRTKAILDETRQNFEERGERIKILNKRAEEFNVEAAKYKAISSAHKEKMKQKAQRWGVF